MQSTRRICFIQPNPVWGACADYLKLLANKLFINGWKVTVLYPSTSNIQPMVEYLEQGIQLVTLPPSTFGSLRHLGSLRQSLRKIQPDIVHFNDPGLVGMLAATLSGIKHRVLTFHTPSQSFSYRFHAKLLYRWVLHQDWQVIALSPTNKITLQNKYAIPEHKINIIEHGLDPAKFQIPNTRVKVRNKFGIAPNCTLLGCVALLKEQKNHALLLKAYATLPQTLKNNSHLLLVGDGKLRSVLEQEVAQLNLTKHVTFAGYRQDIPQLLQAMDIFVLSSNYEGLPFAVLEAMAMGLPVIATAVDGVKDTVIPDKTGLLVPPQQIEPLRDAMAQLISDSNKRKSLGKFASQLFKQHYTVDRMVKETENLYLKLL